MLELFSLPRLSYCKTPFYKDLSVSVAIRRLKISWVHHNGLIRSYTSQTVVILQRK